jgi:hypothetical protein
MPNINKEEFDKKLRALRTKYAIEDNITLTWVIYILLFAIALVLILGASLILCIGLGLFLVGLPFAFIEGVIKGFRKND